MVSFKQYQNQYIVKVLTLVNANHASSNWALFFKVSLTLTIAVTKEAEVLNIIHIYDGVVNVRI